MNEHLKFMQKHNLQDGLLREFVHKELWGPAIMTCNDAIDLRRKETFRLEALRDKLKEEEDEVHTRWENSC